MDQSVMNFATSAARASAIPTPTEGMTSYIGTTGTASIPQIETYTGSAWQTPYGLTQIANVNHAGSSTVSVNNVFSSAFQNYRIIVESRKTADNASPFMRFRAGGVDTVGSNYIAAGRRCISWGGASTDQFFSANDRVPLTDSNGNLGNNRYYVFDIMNPALSEYTAFTISTFYYADNGNFGSFFYNGYIRQTTVFDGMSMNFGDASTGTTRIYGYRNS